MQCPRCQAENREGRRFCGRCGAALELRCAACGFANASDDEFCGGCGVALTAQAIPPPPAAPLDADAPRAGSRGGERRQLTVLFCDLVGSTELATRVDPEVLRDVVRSYQQASGGVISRFGGHVAQYLGDGLLVYFGFPVAHEDDAQRAVRAGLGIIAAMESLNARLQGAPSVRLAVRVGIHTGLVVVGEMGVGERREELALGEAPNVAARLQGMADPDTVLISAATHRLAHSAFACVDLGARAVKGLPAPLPVYRVQGSIATSSPLETSADGAFTPFVGREQEVALLFSRWEQAKDGFGQVVLLSGEAGIGKSRLVRVLKERVAREAHTRWECRCSAYHEDSALFPIVDLFERALEFGREDSPEKDTCLWLGEYATTRSHMEQGLALYDPEQHRALAFAHGGYDPAMACRCFGGHALWYLGYPDQALERHREELAFARELAHPPSLVFALSHAAVLHQFRGEARLAQERAEAAIALSNEHGFEFWRAHASIPRGWALAAQGRVDDGAALILEGLEGYRATGAELERSLWVALLVDAYRKSGRLEEGLAALDEALDDVARTGIRFHEPDLHRLKGELLLGLGTSSPEQATVCLQRAIDIARNRQAKSLELRVTMSMSRLRARQGKREDGRRALAQIHGWFAEGVDTADLREARALLEELSLP